MPRKMTQPRLVADVGGTHARFGWQEGPGTDVIDVHVLPCAAHATLADAIRAYLAASGRGTPQDAAIAIATAVTGDAVSMTNHPWSFSVRALRDELDFGSLRVLNDFTAQALALPALVPSDFRQIGGGTADLGAPIAVLGAGTGLGVSGLVAGHPIEGEGGHVTLAARNREEAEILATMRQGGDHLSAERVLSGPGLESLLHAACGLQLRSSEVIRRAVEEDDSQCLHAIELFCGFLGGFAGNLALTLGARGGVYIAGGIAPRLGPLLDRSRFREAFEDKGRFRGYLAAIPTFLVVAEQSPALRGAGIAIDRGIGVSA